MERNAAKQLSAAEIKRLLGRLDDVLLERGQEAVLYVVGGANVSLAVNSRRSTTDVDAVVKRGFDVVFDAAAEVARGEAGLSPDWLSPDFTGGTPDGGLAWSFFDNKADDRPSTFFEGEALTVELASPEMMLALKTLALRDRDMDDIYELMRMTDIRTADGLGQNLVRFTGPRIIKEQDKPWMPHHIDPSFRFILDNAPDDLRPAPAPKQLGRFGRVFKRNTGGGPERSRADERYRRFPELRTRNETGDPPRQDEREPDF